MPATLPKLSLDAIQIAEPCPYEWAKMAGDERVRRCAGCDKNVYNIAEMTRPEAQALLLTHEGRLCVRLFRRTDGRVITQRCPRAVRVAAGWAWGRLVAVVTLVLTMVSSLLAVMAGEDAALAKRVMTFTQETAQTLRQYEPLKTLYGPGVSRPMPPGVAGGICPPPPMPPMPPPAPAVPPTITR